MPIRKRQRLRTELPPALQSVDVKAVLRKRGTYLKQRENHRLKVAAIPLAKELLKKKSSKQVVAKDTLPQKYTSLSDDQASKYYEKHIHDIETIETHFDQAVKRFLVNTVLVKALAKLESAIDQTKSADLQDKALVKFSTKDIFDDDDEDELVNQAQIDLTPLLQNMAVVSGQSANQLIGIKDPYLESEALRKQIQKNVSLFAKSMVDTDQDQITDIITEGIQNGDSVQQIRSSITDDFSSYSKMQAERITRTEVLRAANQSTLDAFKQSGVVEGKQWLTAGAVDECLDYDGEVETLDGNFYDSGDDPFTDGDPPLHPNCRCVLIPVLEDTPEKATRSGAITRIKELEAQIDKRTKEFKELKRKQLEDRADDKAYIKALEKYLGDDDEQA